MSVAKESFRMTGLFEAEVLVELMLRFWKHPLANDRVFRNELLEAAADSLRAAVNGQQLIPELPASETSLIAAIWYAETVTIQSDPQMPASQLKARAKWLQTIRRALPSCFCRPDLL